MKEKSKYLVVNAGSSSLKFTLFEMPERKELVNGIVERIGMEGSSCILKFNNQITREHSEVNNHADAITLMIKALLKNRFIDSVDEIRGIGHRVLHGGEIYSESVVIDEEVIENIKNTIKLGPIHVPGQLDGIKGTKEVLPEVPMVAVFDTAFHQTISEENYIYPVPYEWYENYGVRKYGFHGTSYDYITNKMKNVLNNEAPNLIVCHIGNGASIAAVKDGKCFNTSMGLTPLDGLMMGTRCGTIDPSIIDYMVKDGKLYEEVIKSLNKNSGLLGISGISSDMRDIDAAAEKGNKNAILARKVFFNYIINFIAQYYFQLEGNVDAIVFTAGIGENNIFMRKQVVNKISKVLNITLDEKENSKISRSNGVTEGIITTSDSKIPVYVVPTNEEVMILNDTYNLVQKSMEQQKTLNKKLR